MDYPRENRDEADNPARFYEELAKSLVRYGQGLGRVRSLPRVIGNLAFARRLLLPFGSNLQKENQAGEGRTEGWNEIANEGYVSLNGRDESEGPDDDAQRTERNPDAGIGKHDVEMSHELPWMGTIRQDEGQTAGDIERHGKEVELDHAARE